MIFLKKSIIRKLVLYLVLLSGLLFGVYYFLNGIDDLPYYYILGAMGVLIIAFVLIYLFDVIIPLKKVLIQIQALLTGDPYKRIYTKRIDEIGVIAHFFNKVTAGFGKVSFDLKDRESMLD